MVGPRCADGWPQNRLPIFATVGASSPDHAPGGDRRSPLGAESGRSAVGGFGGARDPCRTEIFENAKINRKPLSAAEVKKDIFLASLPASLTDAQRQAASARYDAAQKAIASGKAPAAGAGGLSSLMGGARFPGGGFGGQRRPAQVTQTGQNVANQGASASAPAAPPKKPLWFIDDSSKLAVVMVGVGMSDGMTTELVGADNLEGKKVILKIKAE